MMGGLATMSSDLRSGLEAVAGAATAQIAAVRSEVGGVKRDLASVRATVEECHAENMEFFESFTASLEATQHGIEIIRVRIALVRHRSRRLWCVDRAAWLRSCPASTKMGFAP